MERQIAEMLDAGDLQLQCTTRSHYFNALLSYSCVQAFWCFDDDDYGDDDDADDGDAADDGANADVDDCDDADVGAHDADPACL